LKDGYSNYTVYELQRLLFRQVSSRQRSIIKHRLALKAKLYSLEESKRNLERRSREVTFLRSESGLVEDSEMSNMITAEKSNENLTDIVGAEQSEESAGVSHTTNIG
jgi:hypothetical protein